MNSASLARRLRAVAIIPALALGFVACDDDNGATDPGELGTLSEVLRADARVSTLVSALDAAGLDPVLEGAGPYTVFAPANEGFNGLPGGWLVNLLNPVNADLLERILTYHVVPGEYTSGSLSDGQELTTVEGTVLTVNIAGGVITIADASGKDVSIVEADIEASNGVAHITRDILVPELDIVEMARISGYSGLVSLLETASLIETLEGDGPFTVFGPNNLALEGVVAPEGEDLVTVLTYHVVAGEALRAGDLTDGQTLTTFQGEIITVGVDAGSGAVSVTDANGNSYAVSEADVVASNGVLHGIEGLLLPSSDITEVARIFGLSGLVDAAVLAELDDELAQGTWTVFAPTNDVFASLPTDGNGDPIVVNPLLSDLLTYHTIIGEEIVSEQITDGLVFQMTNGDEVTFAVDGGTGAVSITDETGASVNITAVDIFASNGVIHVIDGLLTPSLNVVETATLNGFSTLAELLETATLDGSTLAEILSDEGSEFTVFAPTNEAFDALASVPEGDALTNVLLYHVASGTVLSTELVNGQVVTTLLEGESFTVNIGGNPVAVTLTDANGNTVNVGPVDVLANNGVIHVIDGVILPAG